MAVKWDGSYISIEFSADLLSTKKNVSKIKYCLGCGERI